MKLIVLGSSSNGNCYILDNGNEALIIEAGIRFQEVKKGCRVCGDTRPQRPRQIYQGNGG